MKTKDFRFSLQGSGNLEGAWKADKLACDWEFEKATGNFGVQGQIEHRTLLLKILNVLPPPGPVLGSAVGSAVSWINKQPGYAAEAGASVTLGLTITGEWDTKFPYPDYRFPDHVQEAVVNLAVGPYLRAGFTSDIRAKLSGTIGAKARVWPAFHLKEVYGTTRLELKVYWFVLSKDYTISYIDPSGPATARMALGGLENEPFLDGTLRYDPEAALGTTNVYAPGAVLATVAEDRTHDGAPTVQQAADGTLFMAWCKDNDPRLPQIGSQVFVTDLVNDAWTAPVAVPATLGFNSGVQAITAAQGQRLLVWAHADSSAITPAATLEQLNAVREASALVYSVHDGVAWSAPQPICPGQGAGGDVALGANDAGEVVLCWVRRLETNRVALLSSRWNGSAWSVLEPVAQAPEITHPSLAAQDSAMVVCWAQGDQPGAQVNPRRVFSSTRTSAWSAPALFAPENLVDFPIAASPAPASVRRKDMSWGCRPAVPDDCCDCRTGVKEIRMGSGACVQKTVYSPNCIKYVYYKPCVIAPMDPNDIQGPPGYGLEQWVAVSDPLRYTIRFENDAAVATAPAREVRIVQNLDPALDPRAFRVGSFGFGDLVFNVPDNRAFYTTRLDLRETRGIYLDISAGVDVAAGQAFWSFVSIDPATGDQPLDPYKGFLPPNVLKPEGQGFVSYAIRPRADAATGTRILALATIIFDTQPPIDTPLIFNTLETGGPVSAVAPLPEVVTNSTFAVSWAGADEEGGSGVNAYTIYASDNGGAYRVWLNDTTLTSALFTGQPDHQYAFYSRARDNAGNLEDARETPDARTILRLPNTPPVFEPQPEFFLFFGQTLLLTNRAVDLDLRADRLTFTLGAGSPTNAVLDPVTGVLRWTPGRRAAGCTNLLAVLVTDDGLPPLSATQMLSVVVARDLRIELGSAVVAAGQSGSVSVNLSSLAPVSHLGFTLTCVPAALTNLSLQAANPALVNAALEPLGAGTYRLRLDSELSLAETSPVAYLGFSAVSNQSALVSLLVGEPAALQPGGMAVPRIVPLNGQVAVVGGAPLLSISLAAHAPPVLILYGTPATQYVIQTAPDLAAASWTTYWSGSLTNQFQRLTLSPTNRTMFFRAYH